MRTNAHIHLPPNFSAFASAEDAARRAAEDGLTALGASNYYDFDVYAEFGDACGRHGVRPLFGLEVLALDPDLQARGVRVNDPANPGRVYLCGKALRHWDRAAKHPTLAMIRESDGARMAEMARLLGECLGLALDADSIRAGVARHVDRPVDTVVLQERHLAEAAQMALFAEQPAVARADALTDAFGHPPASRPDDAEAVQAEIRARLLKAGRPAFVPESPVPMDAAIRLITDLGGVPAYPVLADGAPELTEFEADPKELARSLRAWGIEAAEWIPLRNEEKLFEAYVEVFVRDGFTVSAGTEHNTRTMVAMTPTCRGGTPVPAALAERFDAGVEVLLAHQVAR